MSNKRGDDSLKRYLFDSLQAELERKWKEAEDRKGISKEARLKIELRKLPAHWIKAIWQELGFMEKSTKEEQIHSISHILTNPKFLEKILVELSRSSLFILKYLLSKGGWATFQSLSRQANTDENGDGWWWEEEPPLSPLGQLRVRGLVFVGRAPVKKKLYKIAVIPRELRKVIAQVLPRVYYLKDLKEIRLKEKKRFLSQDYPEYFELLEDVKNYFETHIETNPLNLTYEQVLEFLEFLREKNTPLEEIDQAWEDVRCFFEFALSLHPEKRTLDDFKKWDFSFFVSRFIPEEYGEPSLIWEEVCRILHNIAAFYEYLKKKKIVKSDTGIKEALERIVRKDGKISRIFPPPARGPEIIMRLNIPGKKKYIDLTNNDLWSAIVLYIDYNENWQSMILDLEENASTGKIVDARQKKINLQKLLEKMKDTGLTPSRLLFYLKPDRYQIERAKKWFYQKKFISG